MSKEHQYFKDAIKAEGITIKKVTILVRNTFSIF